MATVQKIALSPSRDIPFNKLVLSQSNVRRIKAGISVEELAEDIARRGLLHGLNVRPVLDAEGTETGMFEVPAGGRRYQALALLAKQKRLTKTAPIPCVVRDASTPILAEEDSLAENTQRVPLHPLDQYRAFLDMRTKGMTEEEIAAAFFTTVQVVKQRLRLASVSPKLLDIYAEDGMTLEMLMAFTVSEVHARQEQVAFLWRPAVRDPDGDMVLEAAVNGRAEATVTFNLRDFGNAASRFGVEVLSPGEAWRRLDTSKNRVLRRFGQENGASELKSGEFLA